MERIPDEVVASAIRALERVGDEGGGMLTLLLDLRDARAELRRVADATERMASQYAEAEAVAAKLRGEMT